MSENPIYLELTEEKCLELALENAEQIWWLGKHHERLRITKMLENYFELTQEPNEDGTVTENAEWDTGFQAAIALIRNNTK